MKKIVLIILGILSVFAMGSCEHKTIIYPGTVDGEINIRFLWEIEPDANPKGMTLYFFSLDKGGRNWRFDIAGRNGGPIELPLGSYSMVAFNNDVVGISVDEDLQRREIEAFIKGDGAVTTGCDKLYSTYIERIDVTMCGVSYTLPDGEVKDCPYGVVKCSPKKRYCNYNVIFKNVSGIEYVRQAYAIIENTGGSVNLTDGKIGMPELDLRLSLQKYVEDDKMEGLATAFGIIDKNSKRVLRLQIVRQDGTALEKVYDVTQQIVNSSTTDNVTIVIEDVDIPSTGGSSEGDDVGIEVEIDGWNVIYIEMTS